MPVRFPLGIKKKKKICHRFEANRPNLFEDRYFCPSSAKEFSFSRRETYRALTALHKLRTKRGSRKFIATLSLSIISFFLSFFPPSFHLTERKSPTEGEGHAFFSAHEFSRSKRRRPPPSSHVAVHQTIGHVFPFNARFSTDPIFQRDDKFDSMYRLNIGLRDVTWSKDQDFILFHFIYNRSEKRSAMEWKRRQPSLSQVVAARSSC